MIVSVVREHHWSPDLIERLYFDSVDYEGLEYWYNDIKKVHEELKSKK